MYACRNVDIITLSPGILQNSAETSYQKHTVLLHS